MKVYLQPCRHVGERPQFFWKHGRYGVYLQPCLHVARVVYVLSALGGAMPVYSSQKVSPFILVRMYLARYQGGRNTPVRYMYVQQ